MSAAATGGCRSLLGLDPAAYQPHAAARPGPHLRRRPTATPTSSIELLHALRRRAARRARMPRCGSTSRATSGRSSSRRRRTSSALFGIDIHEMQPYRPLPLQIAEQIDARADDHRRARLLVPARHGRDQLPQRARQDLGRGRGDRPRARAAALLPRRRALRARRRGLSRRLPPRGELSADVLPPYTELVRFDAGAAAGRRASCARPRASRCAAHLAPPPATQPVRALRRAAGARAAGAARGRASRPTTPTRSRRCGWSASAFEVAAAHVDWLLGDGRPAPRPRRCARIVDGCKALGFRLARRRAFDPSRRSRRSARPGSEAIAALEEVARMTSAAGAGARCRAAACVGVEGHEGVELARRLGGGACAPAGCARRRARCDGRSSWRPRPCRGPPRRRCARRPASAWRRARLRRRGLVVSDALRGARRRPRGEEVVLALRRASPPSPRSTSTARSLLDSELDVRALRRRCRRRCCADDNELAICCRALAPLLRVRRRPRARWRTRLVADGELRFFRTMLLGRAPGFAPGPGRGRAVAAGAASSAGARSRSSELELRAAARRAATACSRSRGAAVARRAGSASASRVELGGRSGGAPRAARASRRRRRPSSCAASVRVPDVARWWPHTHGEPDALRGAR